MDERPVCPVCGEPVYLIDNSYSLGDRIIRNPDPTLRHSKDGTVAVARDGTVECQGQAP